jgi:hypothetical protein
MIEGALGIIAASLATLRPLFQRCAGKTKSALQSRNTGDRCVTLKLAKSPLSSTLNCFGGAVRPAADKDTQDSEAAEKCDTMDLESGNHVKVTSMPIHLGVLSSVATETGMYTNIGMTRWETKSALWASLCFLLMIHEYFRLRIAVDNVEAAS